MNMKEVKEFVERWFDERVEIDSVAVTASDNAFEDFIEWLKIQKDRGDGVTTYQFSSAMKYKGFEEKYVGSYWEFPGIKLKAIEEE